MVLPIDEPSDALYRLITHELTHIFEFDIIPRSLLRRGLPLWVDEGLADHMTGYWNAFDLMTVRDAAISDNIPPMSDFQGVAFADGRLPYNLGHAAFEFIESRWGKEGLRQFLFALRKNVIGGGESAYEEAFRLKAEEFDEQFDKYLKDRFKPFRDKERPQDYGRNLAPKREKTPYVAVVSIEASPSGDLMAVGRWQPQGAGARHHPDVDQGRPRHQQPHHRLQQGQGLRIHPDARRLPQQRRAVDVLGPDRRSHRLFRAHREGLDADPPERRHPQDREALRAEDRRPARVAGHQPGRQGGRVLGAERRLGDIFIVNVETGQVRNLTNDQFGDYAPTWAPDGKSIIYLARVSGNDKLFRSTSATGAKTQLTFGTHDDGGAQFVDADTMVFPSTALDPNQPIDPEVARNGNIFNLWTLSLKNGELQAVHRHADRERLADRPEGREGRDEDRLRHLLQG